MMAVNSYCILLKIEGKDNHLAATRCDGLGVEAFVLVSKLVAMAVVDGIGKAIAELQLWNELEERQIVVAA